MFSYVRSCDLINCYLKLKLKSLSGFDGDVPYDKIKKSRSANNSVDSTVEEYTLTKSVIPKACVEIFQGNRSYHHFSNNKRKTFVNGDSNQYIDSGRDDYGYYQVSHTELRLGAISDAKYDEHHPNRWIWNDCWTELPISVSHIDMDTYIVINFYTNDYRVCPARKIPIGGTSLKLFSKHGILRTGCHTVQVWAGQFADVIKEQKYDKYTTPEQVMTFLPGKVSAEQDVEMYTLSKYLRHHQKGYYGHADCLNWLDRMALKDVQQRIEVLRTRRCYPFSCSPDMNNGTEHKNDISNDSDPVYTGSKFYYADIVLPEFKHDGMPVSVLYQDASERSIQSVIIDSEQQVDPDLFMPNLHEDIYYKLHRCKRFHITDKELKPNADIKKKLDEIINQPPTIRLQEEESELLWKYRYYLSSHKKALVKFLHCVHWCNQEEASQAEELLKCWVPMETGDALELLSHVFVGNVLVRSYAVSRLKAAEDEELLTYLLQLVQALRYEDYERIARAEHRSMHNTAGILTATTLTDNNKVQNTTQSTRFSTDLRNPGDEILLDNNTDQPQLELFKPNSELDAENEALIAAKDDNESQQQLLLTQAANDDVEIDDTQQDLASFLITRALGNFKLANYFFWYLNTETSCATSVGNIQQNNVAQGGGKMTSNSSGVNNKRGGEIEDRRSNAGFGNNIRTVKMFETVYRRLLKALKTGNLDHRNYLDNLLTQHIMICALCNIMKTCNASRDDRTKKQSQMQKLMNDLEYCLQFPMSNTTPTHTAVVNSNNTTTLEDSQTANTAVVQTNVKISKKQIFNFRKFTKPFPLPLNPMVEVTGVEIDELTLFKSAMMPAKVIFKTSSGSHYTTIFKCGDDLRQDQLVIQLISLMDHILKRENFDLCLSPYKVLATGRDHGMVEFVQDSQPLALVVLNYGSVQKFLQKFNPSEGAPYNISKEVMNNYVRSCAGYSVITYLLGVGDRHSDNLLLTPQGKLFHIDFGYFLGREPKPGATPIRLSSPMIDGMGGQTSEEFKAFKDHCFSAFLVLRRYKSIFINLFSLMRDAGIPDIAAEPDSAVRKVLDKLMLNQDDAQAVASLRSLIEESANALLPEFYDRVHGIAQYWRK